MFVGKEVGEAAVGSLLLLASCLVYIWNYDSYVMISDVELLLQ